LLTPVLASRHEASIAVAAVSIPHFIATAYRLWIVQRHIDWKLLKSFGLTSAIGGLAGAAVGLTFESRLLELVLAILLLFVGFGGLMGWTNKMKFEGLWAWIAGAISGFLGGLVGNQGGLRAGAMTGVGVSRDTFVATATATGLLVDFARMPVYLAAYGRQLLSIWSAIAIMSVAVIAGTWVGMKVLRLIPEARFLMVVQMLLITLGAYLIAKD
jgi:uncharacterized membrane protein YfcA